MAIKLARYTPWEAASANAALAALQALYEENLNAPQIISSVTVATECPLARWPQIRL
jgi:hypothetical protein